MRIDSKTINADADVVGTTPTAKRTAFDTLMKALNSYIQKPDGDIDLKNLYFYDDRYYKCFVESADPDEKAAGRMSDVKLRFNIPEPFMWAVNKTRVNQALSGATTFTVTNGGSAISRPLITVTNDSSNISSVIIENLTTGQKVSYSGTLATSESLVIDCDKLTVENNGVGDLGNVTNEIGIVLVPGANEFSVTGVASGSINVDFFNRWY
jgi:phage-related protein